MKKIFFVALCTALSVVGCKKDQTPVVTADDAITITPEPEPVKEPEVAAPQVKPAEGEMKELLLVLYRVHFPFDSSTLTESARNALVDASEKLKAMPDVILAVEGNTDLRGTNEYNMSLGERRAQTVFNYLVNLGVDQSRMEIMSYGEENPIAAGAGERVHAQNRRVDFRLKQGNIEFVLEDSPLLDDQGNLLE